MLYKKRNLSWLIKYYLFGKRNHGLVTNLSIINGILNVAGIQKIKVQQVATQYFELKKMFPAGFISVLYNFKLHFHLQCDRHTSFDRNFDSSSWRVHFRYHMCGFPCTEPKNLSVLPYHQTDCVIWFNGSWKIMANVIMQNGYCIYPENLLKFSALDGQERMDTNLRSPGNIFSKYSLCLSLIWNNFLSSLFLWTFTWFHPVGGDLGATHVWATNPHEKTNLADIFTPKWYPNDTAPLK